jgi:hypothetical protein
MRALGDAVKSETAGASKPQVLNRVAGRTLATCRCVSLHDDPLLIPHP